MVMKLYQIAKIATEWFLAEGNGDVFHHKIIAFYHTKAKSDAQAINNISFRAGRRLEHRELGEDGPEYMYDEKYQVYSINGEIVPEMRDIARARGEYGI